MSQVKSISIRFDVANNLHLYIDCFYLFLSRCWLSVRLFVCLAGCLAFCLLVLIGFHPGYSGC